MDGMHFRSPRNGDKLSSMFMDGIRKWKMESSILKSRKIFSYCNFNVFSSVVFLYWFWLLFVQFSHFPEDSAKHQKSKMAAIW